jgi:hypothetical protein
MAEFGHAPEQDSVLQEWFRRRFVGRAFRHSERKNSLKVKESSCQFWAAPNIARCHWVLQQMLRSSYAPWVQQTLSFDLVGRYSSSIKQAEFHRPHLYGELFCEKASNYCKRLPATTTLFLKINATGTYIVGT